MLRALIKTARWNFAQHPRLVEDLTWLLNEADKLEDDRNDAVHSPLMYGRLDDMTAHHLGYAERVIPSLAFDHPRAQKLAKKDLLSEFRWCRDAALVLNEFAGAIYESIAARHPWPKRPSLRSEERRVGKEC